MIRQRGLRKCTTNVNKLGVTYSRVGPNHPSTSWLVAPENMTINREQYRLCSHFLSKQNNWKQLDCILCIDYRGTFSRRSTSHSSCTFVLSKAKYNPGRKASSHWSISYCLTLDDDNDGSCSSNPTSQRSGFIPIIKLTCLLECLSKGWGDDKDWQAILLSPKMGAVDLWQV